MNLGRLRPRPATLSIVRATADLERLERERAAWLDCWRAANREGYLPEAEIAAGHLKALLPELTRARRLVEALRALPLKKDC